MSWKSHIDELRARERLAEQMGGEERVALVFLVFLVVYPFQHRVCLASTAATQRHDD